MKKMFAGMLMAVAMVFVSACGGVDPPDHQAEPGVQQEAAVGTAPAQVDVPQPGRGIDYIDWDEHVTFSWFMIHTPVNDFYTSYSDNPAVRYLNYRFNVTFDFEQPVTGTESDALALMIGARRFTDAIHLAPFGGNILQLYDDGIIIDIAQWLDYMPNFRNLIENYPDVARVAFNDDGRILMMPLFNDVPEYPFAGLMYHHDILYAMTDGNIQFPSGNDVPTTIADWEYMLPLFLEYFQAAGFADFAPLILPVQGFIHFGALINSFGAAPNLYVRNGVVNHGILEPEFFTYISTMRDWFERGWIHQDFASRTGDMFFMPNPPLVFGGAAGIWYGLPMHLGDRMSMPEFGMNFYVKPIPSPMADGITHKDMLRRRPDRFGIGRHSAVSATNPDIGRFLAIMDFMFTEEGGRLLALGVNADQIPPGCDILERMGMPEGSWWFDDAGNVVLHPYTDIAGGHISLGAIMGNRLPGLSAQSDLLSQRSPEMVHAHSQWSAHCYASEVFTVPDQLSFTVAESDTIASTSPHITDLRDQNLVMFIMGTQPLNETTWEAFLDQLRGVGLMDYIAAHQAAYDRFMARGQ